MSEELAPVPIADDDVRRLFAEPEFRVAKRGYDPDDVVAFLDGLGSRVVHLISRVRGAEAAAKTAQDELAGYRHRVEQAESSRQIFDRTLALAEETANASVADAKGRADRIDTEAQQDARRMIDETRLRVERMMDAARVDVQRVYNDERRSLEQAQTRVQAENDQLETLRLAVAAETMALEEVRNELRRRIRRVATELLGVAESPDCLGVPVTRGIPEVVAGQSPAHADREISVPTGGEISVTTAGPPPPPPPPPPATVDAAPGVGIGDAIDLVEPAPSEPHDEDPASAATPAPPPTSGDAFDRFMSDEIEEEPSRTWILT